MSNLEAIIDDQRSESVIKTLACVASVSSRVIARKLEREQKQTRAETLATQAIKTRCALLVCRILFEKESEQQKPLVIAGQSVPMAVYK